MQVWEYTRVLLEGEFIFEYSPMPAGLTPRMKLDEALMKLGQAGWEIATSIPGTNVNTLILKRPRS